MTKGTRLCEYTLCEPFGVKFHWGLTPTAEIGKSQKVSNSHRIDMMWPITQGFIYRSVFDKCFYLHQLLKCQRKKKQSSG